MNHRQSRLETLSFNHLDLTNDIPPPRDVQRFLREANRRIERFRRDQHIPGFVPSDYATVYTALATLTEATPLRGRLFCEWGSGFGVVACLAAMLDFDSFGIEIDETLVGEAQQLAEDFGLPVEFICDSFIPGGSEISFRDRKQFAWLTTSAGEGDRGTALEPSDFDVIFAYPWPDEERVIESLFARHARQGAILVTYHAEEEIRLRRKERRRSRR